ncbi:MAG: hypothetical protein LBI59_08040 [Candidatus Accumulibacter sp.]|jgi:TolA-binding protein|nr:hypothetical protein [Accumulibacter sp.]
MKLPRLSFSRRDAARRTFRLSSRAGGGAWLQLAWDLAGLRAAVARGGRQRCEVLALAQSREAHFSSALAEVIGQLRGRLQDGGHRLPRRVALAARHMRPATVVLPVNPGRPRPDAQMRELLRGDLEPALAEFGGLWTMGALLAVRGYLSAADRDRVVAEETLRREDRRTPLRYGETALELSLIDRAALNECMELQESLQYFNGELMSAWTGYVEDSEKYWLAAAATGRQYRQWNEALDGYGLALDTTLPLSWLCSEGADDAREDIQRLSIELHAEEVFAVRRRRGRIVAARNEGRLERPLQSDWLGRLIEDWSGEGRAEIELVCLSADDEPAAARAAGELELTSGHPVRVVAADAAWQALWPALLREAAAEPPERRLPRLTLRELRGKPWKNPDFLRVAAVLAVALALAATEGVQRHQLRGLRQALAERTKKEGEEQKLSQLIQKANAEVQQVARELETARRELEPLINERARLEALERMRQYLPDLLRALGQAAGGDAVLERVGNGRAGDDVTVIRVEGWSPTYTGAQSFVARAAERVRALAYGVMQAEVREGAGRGGKNGYQVGFWLVQEADELEQAQEGG